MTRDNILPIKATYGVTYLYLPFLALLFFSFVWRMQGITQWPMPFHPTLQYENALNTRAIWNMCRDLSESETLWLNGYEGRQKGIWIIESLTVFVYLITGSEIPWITGVFTTLCWLLAAWLLFDIAQRYCKFRLGAFATASLFLLHAFSMVVSRSFQHESMMILGLILAWWWLARQNVLADSRSALIAAVVCGMALLGKPGIGWIPFCFIHLAYAVERLGWRRALTSLWLYLVPLIALLPSLLWMKLVLTTDEWHQWKWSLLADPYWYTQTASQLIRVAGWCPLAVLVLMTGWNIYKRQWIIPILVAGFLVYAAVFNYACMTHDYYLLPLFPIMALAWGQLFRRLWLAYHFDDEDSSAHRQTWQRHAWWVARRSMPCILIALLTWILTHWGNWNDNILNAGPYQPDRSLSFALRKQLGVGTDVIALTNDYAMPLRFFSGLHAQWWPTTLDLTYESLNGKTTLTAKDRLTKMLNHRHASYFIITLESEFQQQKDLIQALSKYPELPDPPPGVRIYDLRERK